MTVDSLNRFENVCVKMTHGSLICASKFIYVRNRPAVVSYWEHSKNDVIKMVKIRSINLFYFVNLTSSCSLIPAKVWVLSRIINLSTHICCSSVPFRPKQEIIRNTKKKSISTKWMSAPWSQHAAYRRCAGSKYICWERKKQNKNKQKNDKTAAAGA